ncbi:PAS domain S-box protein [Variovorax sp. ZT5P49]|uniref:PAS domain S-box protein n=1 Tax=Variovorax sp. ZT5P49 TaxID=3443733 RepID=UPI003F447C0A
MNDTTSPGNELYRSAEEFRVLFDLCPIATYVIDAAGVIVKFNDLATKLWGREPVLGDTDEKFCGSHQMYLLDGTPLPHDECPMTQVVSGAVAEVTDAQVVVERPDGSRVTVIVNIRPLQDAQGEIVGAINCFYEMSCPISIPIFAKLQPSG